MPIVLPVIDGLDGSRCFVTGGAGFIGSSLVRVLLSSGADVTVYDNFATGSPLNLAGCTEEVGSEPTVIEGDIRRSSNVEAAMRGHDFVFHLACLGVRHSLHAPQENHEVNAGGTLTLLLAARSTAPTRFIHVSSSEVYGTARFAPMTESHPTEPHTVYGGSKLAGESYARAFYQSHGMPCVVIRPFNSYGPRSHHEGDSGEVIPRFLVLALSGRALVVFGDGEQTRDLTHVYDTAAAIARAAIAADVVGGTFNVGSGSEISVNDLAEMVRRVCGAPDLVVEHVEARPGDVRRLIADSSRASSLRTGAGVTLEEGMVDLAQRLERLGSATISELADSIRVRNWM